MGEGGKGASGVGTFSGRNGGGVGRDGVSAPVQEAVSYVLCMRRVTVRGAVVFGVVCECRGVVWGRLWRRVGKILRRAIWWFLVWGRWIS